MDNLDQMQESQEQILDLRIKAATRKSAVPAAFFCEECGEPIPEIRRKSIPGVRLCVDCKNAEEVTARNFR